MMRFVSSSFQTRSRALVGINNISVFCLAFPNIAFRASPLLFIGILQDIAAGIGTFNFLRAAFIVSLNSSSIGSMKNIPLNCLALSSFGFSTAHLCFAFFFFGCIRQNFPHIWTYTIWTRGSVFPRESSTGPRASVKWSFVQQHESCEPCPCILAILLFHPRSHNLQYFLPTVRPDIYMLFW